MANTYELHPEVPGHFGESTVVNRSNFPPIIENLELVFDGWLGDDLTECFPCFFITTTLLDALLAEKLSGFSSCDLHVSSSFIFMQLHPDMKMPSIRRLLINGTNNEDFFINSKNNLCVSERALEILRQKASIQNCEIRFNSH